MANDAIPNLGYIQPSIETDLALPWAGMSQKTKGKRGHRPASAPARALRRTLAENIQLLIDWRYDPSQFNGVADQQIKYAKDAGVAWSTVQRALNQHVGKTLDILADLAVPFHLSPWELLDPDLKDRIPFMETQTTTRQAKKVNP